MSYRPLWQEIHERFDPELPARAEWRVDRTRSPVGAMVSALDRPFGTPYIMVTGTVGTGKTTEMLRVAEGREQRELVVFLDLARHFTEAVKDPHALDRINSWEVCLLAGLALVARFRERLRSELDGEMVKQLANAWKAMADATQTASPSFDSTAFVKHALDMGQALLATAGVGTGATELLKKALDAAQGWNLPLGRSEKVLPDQDRLVQNLMGAINLLVGEVQHKHRRVLFVIDGLDRIRDLKRAEALFVESGLISQLACPVVVCGPFALRHDLATAGVRVFKPRPLVNEPVLDHEDPRRHGPGVAFFRELFQRRVANLTGASELVSGELLDELAYRSGGRARDFVRFIRSLAELAWDQDAPAATPALVKQVLDEWRLRQETGLHKGHIQLLDAVMRDPKHQLPEGPLAEELLDYQHLLPYPNESEWYYPHPLLTMHLLEATPAGSGG